VPLGGSRQRLFFMKYYFNNARNALRVFLRAAGVKELFAPFELCSVVFKAARVEGVNLKFYHVDKNFYPLQEFPQNAYILYPNYFGICDEQALKLSKLYPNLIYDAAHAYFTEPLGVATIYSARKFLPVADGGILVTDIEVSTDFKKEVSVLAPADYEEFLKNELRFNRTNEIKLISDESYKVVSGVCDAAVRLKNFYNLHKILGTFNELKIPKTLVSPFVYPLKTDNCRILDELSNSGHLILRYDYLKDIMPVPLDFATQRRV